jgi:ankyrin repeat protein
MRNTDSLVFERIVKYNDDDFGEPNIYAEELQVAGTVLQIAAYYGRQHFVELFLSHGADVNATGENCRNALHYAVHMTRLRDEKQDLRATRYSIVKLLLASGADPNPLGASKTPLQAAVRNLDEPIVALLLESGARPNAIGNDEACIEKIRELVGISEYEGDNSTSNC